jgi:hypothetical protein
MKVRGECDAAAPDVLIARDGAEMMKLIWGEDSSEGPLASITSITYITSITREAPTSLRPRHIRESQLHSDVGCVVEV